MTLTALLLVLLSVAACTKKDKCEIAECTNGGECVDGSCNCPEGYSGPGCECSNNAVYNSLTQNCECKLGYEGNNCETVARDKFIGTYNSSVLILPDNTTNNNVPLTISTDQGIPLNAAILNFVQSNFSLTIIGDSCYFPSTFSGGYQYDGHGTITGNTLNFTLNETGSQNSVYLITAIKQ